MSFRTLGFLIVLLIAQCLAMACHHGDDDLALPTIDSITPSGTVGKVGDSVVITAVVTGSVPLFYSWTLSGGGTITSGAGTATPTITFSTAGSFTLSLTVTNAGGSDSDSVPIDIDPAIPVVESVSPSGAVGLPAGTATFAVEATSQPTGWTWEFASDSGTVTILTETAEITLPNPGTYFGTVMASNANGDSDPFPFEYTVTQPVFPEWQITDLGPADSGFLYGQTSCTVLDGRLAVLYNAPDGVKLARALVAYPTGMGGWQIHTVSTDLRTGLAGLVVYQGKLVASLGGLPGHGVPKFFCAVATVAEPSGPSDWAIHEVDAEGAPPPLAVIDGALCAAYGSQFASSEEPVRFARTTASPPTSAADWDFHSLPSPPDSVGIGGPLQILVVGDQLVVYWGSIQTVEGDKSFRVSVSDTLEPTDAGDWYSQEVALAHQPSTASLVDLGGRVGVFFSENDPFNPEGGQSLLFTSDSVPLSSSTVWSPYTLGSVQTFMGRTSGMVLGRPYVFTEDYVSDTSAGQLRLVRAIGVDPLQEPAPLSWEFGVVDAGPFAGQLPSSAVIGDRILVAYINGDPGVLNVAVAKTVY
ncbi:MAG: PKD domain-containing protein [bacterium]